MSKRFSEGSHVIGGAAMAARGKIVFAVKGEASGRGDLHFVG